MSVVGDISIVIEGEPGRTIHDEIMALMPLLNSETGVELFQVDGRNYSLSLTPDDSAAYLLSLYEDDTYCGATGVFSFRYEHDMLRIEGEWRGAPTLLFYLQDKGLMQYEGLYYFIQSELEFPDATSNDVASKYFQMPGFIASLRRQGDGWDIHRVDADMRAYHAAQYPDTDTQIALEQERELWLNFVQDEQMQDLAQYALLAKAGQTYLHWLESKIKEE